MEWITANWKDILTIITGVIAVASVVTRLTPTKVDDNVLGYIVKFIDVLSVPTKPTEIKK